MSVTIYLTDHRGKQIAFFYRISNERYLTTPQLLWACRDHPEYQGTAESKEDFMEQCKSVMRELSKRKSEAKTCDKCGLTNPKMEAQDTCPHCLIND
jgi:hypothetical protein